MTQQALKNVGECW